MGKNKRIRKLRREAEVLEARKPSSINTNGGFIGTTTPKIPEITYKSAIEDYVDNNFVYDPYDWDEDEEYNIPPEVQEAYSLEWYSYSKYFDEQDTLYTPETKVTELLREQLAKDLGGVEHRNQVLTKNFALNWLYKPSGITFSQLKLLVEVNNIEEHRIVHYLEFFLSKITGERFFLPDLGSSGAFDLQKLGLDFISKIRHSPSEEDLLAIQNKVREIKQKGWEDSDAFRPALNDSKEGALRYANQLSRVVGIRFSLEKGFYHQKMNKKWYQIYELLENSLRSQAEEARKKLSETLSEYQSKGEE